jgi:hypothetical protein
MKSLEVPNDSMHNLYCYFVLMPMIKKIHCNWPPLHCPTTTGLDFRLYMKYHAREGCHQILNKNLRKALQIVFPKLGFEFV